jgi:hypothetical protein
MEAGAAKTNFMPSFSSEKNEYYLISWAQAVFSSTKNVLFQKKIPCHIKLAIHAWSTKCRWIKN